MKRRRLLPVLLGLAVALGSGIIASAMHGQLDVSPGAVVGTIAKGLGWHTNWAPNDELIEQTLWQIRFPRIVMSMLVGIALSIAGAMMQAIFGNPLAEPGIVGVSSGAALGAAAAIVLPGIGGAVGLASVASGATIALAAFVGGLIATFLVYATARSHGRTEMVTLVLTGIAVNAICSAGMALLLFLGSTAAREQVVFWQLGTINGSRWSEVAIVAVLALPIAVLAVAFGRKYDLLALGERTAAHLGVQVERLRIVSIVLVALATSAAVSFVGIISFVGLVVPHLVRMLLGPAHRRLIAVSVLAGGVLMVWADLGARSIVARADLPIGLLTALIGGPFFFWLIRRTRKQAGGWA